MSTFRKSLEASSSMSPGASELELRMRSAWPNLADALFGVIGVVDQSVALPSCSIILFVEGDRLKYCLTPQGSDKVAFGTISEPLEGFSGLESSLAAGDFAWRAKRGRR
jgi:hypothetical protein